MPYDSKIGIFFDISSTHILAIDLCPLP
jgi:hypothetical protein